MKKQIGNYILEINKDVISIEHKSGLVNLGMVYSFKLKQWLEYKGPEWNKPQIIGMDHEPSKTVLKEIYRYLKTIKASSKKEPTTINHK
jgi:hypothetical protein